VICKKYIHFHLLELKYTLCRRVHIGRRNWNNAPICCPVYWGIRKLTPPKMTSQQAECMKSWI